MLASRHELATLVLRRPAWDSRIARGIHRWGGGLLLARGLLFPAELPRRDSLIYYGGQGVRLALGIIPLLLVAGVLEGFFSPSYLPAAAKFACSAAAGGVLFLYLNSA